MNQHTNLEVMDMPYKSFNNMSEDSSLLRNQELKLKQKMNNVMSSIDSSIMFNNTGIQGTTETTQESFMTITHRNRTEVDKSIRDKFTKITTDLSFISENIMNIQGNVNSNGEMSVEDIPLYNTLKEMIKDVTIKMGELDKQRGVLLESRVVGVKELSKLFEDLYSIDTNMNELEKTYNLSVLRISDITQVYKKSYSTYLMVGLGSLLILIYAFRSAMN